MLRSSHILLRLFSFFVLHSLVMGSSLSSLPPMPKDYILDDSGVLDPARKKELSKKLKSFEEETSNQIVVAVIPKVPEDYVMEDFTQRTAEAWGVGQKGKDNGVVLFVFPQSRMVRIEVGYGLEGAIPDALANDIIQSYIIPPFRNGYYMRGVEVGVHFLIKASRGEYKGRLQPDSESHMGLWFFVIAAAYFLFCFIYRYSIFGYSMYKRSGRIFGRNGFFGSRRGLGGSRRGSSSSGGRFRGFRGGGGRFGGGGASGRW